MQAHRSRKARRAETLIRSQSTTINLQTHFGDCDTENLFLVINSLILAWRLYWQPSMYNSYRLRFLDLSTARAMLGAMGAAGRSVG